MYALLFRSSPSSVLHIIRGRDRLTVISGRRRLRCGPNIIIVRCRRVRDTYNTTAAAAVATACIATLLLYILLI